MARRKLKVGDRVHESWLGFGTVTEVSDILPGWYSVMFDANPPLQFNMGQNPTLEPGDRLERYNTEVPNADKT